MGIIIFITSILLQFLDPIVWLVSGLAGWFIPNRFIGVVVACVIPNVIAAIARSYVTDASRSLTSIFALSIAATTIVFLFAWLRKKRTNNGNDA